MKRVVVVVIILVVASGCQTAGRSIVSDRTPPGRYELVDPKANRRLTVLEIPPGQRVGLEYERSRTPTAAVILSERSGGGDTSTVWRQVLPKGSHYEWRSVAKPQTTTQP
jgi:hypothetical protein